VGTAVLLGQVVCLFSAPDLHLEETLARFSLGLVQQLMVLGVPLS